MNKKVPEITESVEVLKDLLRKARKKHEILRLNMLYLLKSGEAKNRVQVARLLGVDRTSVGTWLQAYETGGLEKMLQRGYAPGREPILTEEQQTLLLEELRKPEGFTSYVEIQKYIADTFGVKMNYKTVYAMVHDKWGAKLKVPRKSHVKKNAVATETFRSEFSKHVADAVAEKGADFQSVRVFSQDETRYGLLPTTERRITQRGVKPVAKIDYQYTSVYLYGAVEPLTGERFFLELSHLTSDCFQCFIDAVSVAYAESLNLLVLDKGRFHHAKSLVVPANVVLLFLPPYSPELNPIERFWQDLKAKLFTEFYETLEAMQAQVTEILQSYSDAAIAKLTGFSHFIKAANAV